MSVKKLKIEYAYKTLNNDYYKNKMLVNYLRAAIDGMVKELKIRILNT